MILLKLSYTSQGTPGPMWSTSLSITEVGGSFPWSSSAMACYLWLDICPSIEFLCVEHIRNLSSPPSPKLTSVVWAIPKHLVDNSFNKKKMCKPRHQEGKIFKKEIWDYKAAQGWSESHGFTNSAKKSKLSLSSWPICALCLLSQWALSSKTDVLNFLWRTLLKYMICLK